MADQPPAAPQRADYQREAVRQAQEALADVEHLDTATVADLCASSLAHAIELAGRVLGVPPDAKGIREVVSVLENPSQGHTLAQAWRDRHPSSPAGMIRDAIVYFLTCRLGWLYTLYELARRAGQSPVYRTWAELAVSGVTDRQADAMRGKAAVRAMEDLLRRTVKRRLDVHREDVEKEDEADAIMDALTGAVEAEQAALRRLQDACQRGKVDLPIVPLPEVGLGLPDVNGRGWRMIGRALAIRTASSAALAAMELLDRPLADAAHAAGRAERDKQDAKKRGGTGGRKARKAGTTEPAVMHYSLDWPESPDSDTPLGDTVPTDTPTPEEDAAASEEKAFTRRLYLALMEEAERRWGSSGRRMLATLAEGQSYRKAAKAAGISLPAVLKRLDTLRKLGPAPDSSH